MRRSGYALAALFLAACSRSGPSRPPAPPVPADRIVALVKVLATQDDEAPGHGKFHRARNEVERELWAALGSLPAAPDTILLLCVEGVYTRYDANYFNGYLWHWPYLCSPRAVALCDRILRDHPRSGLREQALWLKAFALRCPRAEPHPQAEEDLDVYREQRNWKPDFDAARACYREIVEAYPQGRHAATARALAARPDLMLALPVSPLDPDPRD